MRKAVLRAGFVVFMGVSAAMPAFATDPPARTRVGTVTRLVKIFLDKEAALAEAARSGNQAALEAYLAEDFELRAGFRAANPVPRAEWVAEVVRKRDAGGEASRMAVHEMGSLALASFTQEGAGGPMFVVDVWRQQGGDWKLAIRYASPSGSAAFPIPGVGASEAEIPKKY